MSSPILQPAAIMMLLTIAVWCYMYFLRISFSIRHKISPQKISSPERINAVLPARVNQPSNNLKNLFELPVIFYAICIALHAMEQTDYWFIGLAWAFTLLRILHSIIHCTSNQVMVRFSVYILSSIVLWVMVLRFTLLAF